MLVGWGWINGHFSSMLVGWGWTNEHFSFVCWVGLGSENGNVKSGY